MKRYGVECPGCGRTVMAVDGRYETHHRGAESRYCFMSGMPEPVEGLDHPAMVKRAQIVACLAQEVQDSDPHEVWHYLSSVPPGFVKELLQVALAALDVEGRTVSEIWKKWSMG